MGFLNKFGLGQEGVNRKFYASIDPGQILDDNFSATDIVPESNYFQIRMKELLLRDKNELFRSFIPLAVSVCKFKYDGQSREVPFLVGNQLLDSIDSYVEDEHVEYRNIRILGPVPYNGDDVGLFIGLFRVEVSNLLEEVFGFMEKIIGAFDLAKLTSYLPIAEMVSDGLANLMGMKQIEMRLGTMDNFSGASSGSNTFKSGYLAFINCLEGDIKAKHLWVNDGLLMTGSDRKALKRFTSHDYCLVQVEALNERSDLDTLPFHLQWKKAKTSIWDGNMEAAKRNYLTLMAQIASTPDLTETHRSVLIQAYLANYQKEKELYNQVIDAADGGESAATRGSRAAGSMSARGVIQKAASLSKSAEIKQEDKVSVKKTLKKISASWNKIPHLETRTRDFEITSGVLNAQIKALADIQTDTPADSEALAEAITYAAFHE
jgi:hypothetical protein